MMGIVKTQKDGPDQALQTACLQPRNVFVGSAWIDRSVTGSVRPHYQSASIDVLDRGHGLRVLYHSCSAA